MEYVNCIHLVFLFTQMKGKKIIKNREVIENPPNMDLLDYILWKWWHPGIAEHGWLSTRWCSDYFIFVQWNKLQECKTAQHLHTYLLHQGARCCTVRTVLENSSLGSGGIKWPERHQKKCHELASSSAAQVYTLSRHQRQESFILACILTWVRATTAPGLPYCCISKTMMAFLFTE